MRGARSRPSLRPVPLNPWRRDRDRRRAYGPEAAGPGVHRPACRFPRPAGTVPHVRRAARQCGALGTSTATLALVLLAPSPVMGTDSTPAHLSHRDSAAPLLLYFSLRRRNGPDASTQAGGGIGPESRRAAPHGRTFAYVPGIP